MGKIHSILGFFLFFFASNICATAGTKFILITFLYNETHSERRQEYIACLENNLKHPLIEKIHVLYDTTKDDGECELLHYLESKNITITFNGGRPTYSYCFELANQFYANETIILSNADISFNETLSALSNCDLENTFIALTRWDDLGNGDIKPYLSPNNRPSTDSQDVWIFKTPFEKLKNANIEMGLMGCDGKIAYSAKKAGLLVINPCLTIQAIHLHSSEIRNYSRDHKCKKSQTLKVSWCALGDSKDYLINAFYK